MAASSTKQQVCIRASCRAGFGAFKPGKYTRPAPQRTQQQTAGGFFKASLFRLRHVGAPSIATTVAGARTRADEKHPSRNCATGGTLNGSSKCSSAAPPTAKGTPGAYGFFLLKEAPAVHERRRNRGWGRGGANRGHTVYHRLERCWGTVHRDGSGCQSLKQQVHRVVKSSPRGRTCRGSHDERISRHDSLSLLCIYTSVNL